MNKIMKFNCVDKNELLKAFVTSNELVKAEESILPFNQKLELLVTSTNKARVPASEKIALATGVAKLSKKGSSKIAIRVADDGVNSVVTLTLKDKMKDLSEESWGRVNAFLDDLQERGYKFERIWS